jgi:hypothetical protein
MGWATFYATISQTHLVTLTLIHFHAPLDYDGRSSNSSTVLAVVDVAIVVTVVTVVTVVAAAMIPSRYGF